LKRETNSVYIDDDLSPTEFFNRNLGSDVKKKQTMAEKIGTFDGVQYEPLLRKTNDHTTPIKKQRSTSGRRM
jgi:hypothetical protein